MKTITLLPIVVVLLSMIGITSVICDITIPTNYPTIQQGISNATEGQTVCVNAGTYAWETYQL